jgi:hypothetical protein
MEASRMKIVYVVLDRYSRAAYSRIGVAFVDSDGSMRVKLEAIPLSGEMHIVDYIPKVDYIPRLERAAEAPVGPSAASTLEPGSVGPSA